MRVEQLSSATSPGVPALRARFPALARTHEGRPVLFFDNPAGTQVPQEMIDGISGYLRHSNANTGGLFATSQETDHMLEEAHATAADFLGASSGEIVFGPNMTTLTFEISHALGRTLQPGDEIRSEEHTSE